MLLVQKIFYYHFADVDGGDGGGDGLRRRQRDLPVQGHRRAADRIGVASAELVVIFGLFGLVSGSLWGRKAWGIWWQWDARAHDGVHRSS